LGSGLTQPYPRLLPRDWIWNSAWLRSLGVWVCSRSRQLTVIITQSVGFVGRLSRTTRPARTST